MTKVMQVIFTDNKTRGTGVYPDPVRLIPEILDFDVNTIMEHDSEIQFTMVDMLSFGEFYKHTGYVKPEDIFQEWEKEKRYEQD